MQIPAHIPAQIFRGGGEFSSSWERAGLPEAERLDGEVRPEHGALSGVVRGAAVLPVLASECQPPSGCSAQQEGWLPRRDSARRVPPAQGVSACS